MEKELGSWSLPLRERERDILRKPNTINKKNEKKKKKKTETTGASLGCSVN